MELKFLQVEKCCFYLPLSAGAKFFGFLSLSGSLLMLTFGCFYLIHLVKRRGYIYEDLTEQLVETGVNLTVQIIQICTATLMLLGVYQRKPKLIPYWLFTTPIVAVLELTVLGNITFLFIYVRRYELDWFILNTITIFDDFYGWIVTYSYYCSTLVPEAAVV